MMKFLAVGGVAAHVSIACGTVHYHNGGAQALWAFVGQANTGVTNTGVTNTGVASTGVVSTGVASTGATNMGGASLLCGHVHYADGTRAQTISWTAPTSTTTTTTTTTAGREIVGAAGVGSGSAGVGSGSAGVSSGSAGVGSGSAGVASGSAGVVNSGTTGVVGSGNTNTDSKALSGGIIATIVLACIAFLICLFACCFFMKIKHGNEQAEEYDIEAPVVIISRRESVHVAPVMEVVEERVVEYNDTPFVRHVIVEGDREEVVIASRRSFHETNGIRNTYRTLAL